MVQGARPSQILLARLVTAVTPPWLATVLVAVVVTVLGAKTTGHRLALWLAGFTAYAALWVAAAAWIASWRPPSSQRHD